MRKTMLGTLTAVAVTAGSLVSLAGPAQAYDRGTCDQKFGVGNWADEDTFKVDTGEVGQVDFGDNLHLFGQPQGTAVVCFATDGAVSLTGRLFADSGLTVINVEAKVTYFRGTVAASTSSHELITSMAGSKVVNQVRTGGNFTKVRIRLYSVGELRHTVNILKGD
jgi:hypothetical protein